MGAEPGRGAVYSRAMRVVPGWGFLSNHAGGAVRSSPAMREHAEEIAQFCFYDCEVAVGAEGAEDFLAQGVREALSGAVNFEFYLGFSHTECCTEFGVGFQRVLRNEPGF